MMTSTTESKESNGPLTESTTLRKGLLWQQWDKFFSRWKERYFVLTKDYLACFKKESKVGTSEMGGFLYKVNLADVEGLQWADKKRTGVIAIRVGTEGQLLLWTNTGLDDWMFALRDAIGRSKGRREALRKAHTLGPQFCDAGLTRRQALILHHTLSDSQVQSPSVRTSTSCELRSLGERMPTPNLARRAQRMSVATEASQGSDMDTISEYETRSVPWSTPLGPRLAPQCSGSYSSLVSLGGRSASINLQKPSPRSLQVSPALAQRSLYAQHVLSSPEVVVANGSVASRSHKSATSSATLEFSYIRPDSPVTLTGPRSHHHHYHNNYHGRPTQSSTLDGSGCIPREYTRSQSCFAQSVLEPQDFQPPAPRVPHRAPPPPPTGPPCNDSRPCSIYGQPSLTVEKPAYSVQPPDVVPVTTQPKLKRPIKAYQHSKSDTSFVLSRHPLANAPGEYDPGHHQGHMAVT